MGMLGFEEEFYPLWYNNSSIREFAEVNRLDFT